MKNLKANKVQILAALALAFSLGMAMPSAVFASEEGAGEPAAQSNDGANNEEDGAGEKEELLDLDESVAELYKRIQATDNKAFTAYRNSLPLITNTEAIQDSVLLQNTKTWAQSQNFYLSGASFTVWIGFAEDTKTTVENLPVYKAITAMKADSKYTVNASYKTIVDNLETSYTDLSGKEVTLVKAAFPELPNVDSMDLQELVNTVTKNASYSKYVALSDAMGFLKNAIVAGDDGSSTVSVDALNTLYSEADLMKNYSAMANAAKAIDASATTGLATFTLPTTSVGGDDKNDKPTTPPDTGILGLIETGALDLGTVTLIVSVAVASVAGAALIAKLYLKHKF